MSEAILFETSGQVAKITLNRPERLNALSNDMLATLRERVESAAADEQIRALLITGAGRGFCAGADLVSRDNTRTPQEVGNGLRNRYHPIIMALRRMDKPVISAVNGVAAGAGMSLALSADIVLAGRSASFLQAFSKIGLIPDAGSTWFLDRYAGSMRARALAMLAEKIPAQQALEFGLVWQLHDDDKLMAEADKLAQHMASQPTRAYALIKRTLDAASGNSLIEQLEVEAQHQQLASTTADHAEGIEAFLQKRTPVFKGK